MFFINGFDYAWQKDNSFSMTFNNLFELLRLVREISQCLIYMRCLRLRKRLLLLLFRVDSANPMLTTGPTITRAAIHIATPGGL